MSTAPAIKRDRPDWHDLRAFLCLLLVGTAASLVLIFAETLVVGPAYLFFGLTPGDNLETPFRVVIPVALLIIAAIGLRVFRCDPVIGRFAGPVTTSALPLGVAAVAVLIVIAWISGVAERAPAAMFGPGLALAILGVALVLLQVISEELLLRGLLQPVLIRAWGVVPGIAVAALAFAFVHFAGGWREPLSLLNIALAGIWFGLLAWRSAGLLAPILAHFGYNWSEEMLFGASPNPGVSAYGSAFDFELSGHSIWGGSGDGFNASIILTAILLLLIVPLAIKLPGMNGVNRDGAGA